MSEQTNGTTKTLRLCNEIDKDIAAIKEKLSKLVPLKGNANEFEPQKEVVLEEMGKLADFITIADKRFVLDFFFHEITSVFSSQGTNKS